MAGLLNAVLDAHGGLDNWRKFSRVEATIVTGGGLWAIKGEPRSTTEANGRRIGPPVGSFGPSAPTIRNSVYPERVVIEKLDGRVVSERLNPRESFDGHEFATPWDPLQRAYFNGYALWTYLTTPFLLTLEGVSVRRCAG